MLRSVVMVVVRGFALIVSLVLFTATVGMLVGEPESEPEVVRTQSPLAPGSQAQGDVLPHERESFDFSQVESSAGTGLAERVADLSAMTHCNIRFQESARHLYAAGAVSRWTENAARGAVHAEALHSQSERGHISRGRDRIFGRGRDVAPGRASAVKALTR